MNADVLRDSFLKFMADGMSYEEALEQFDQREFSNAALAEVESGEAICTLDRGFVTNDERKLPGLFELLIRANFQRRDSKDMEQAIELWTAGWTSEDPNPQLRKSGDFWLQCQTMSLYWRRPPRTKHRKGRLFLSTNQAWRAMKKERTDT